MKRRNLYFTAFAVIAIALSVFAVFDFNDAERRLCDAGVYDMLSPELVEIYEREIAGQSIVSSKTQAQLDRAAGRIGIDINKLKAIMLLQDLAGRVNRDISLDELAAMSDIKLLGFFKQCGDEYLATLTEERRSELKKMLTDCIKFPVRF